MTATPVESSQQLHKGLDPTPLAIRGMSAAASSSCVDVVMADSSDMVSSSNKSSGNEPGELHSFNADQLVLVLPSGQLTVAQHQARALGFGTVRFFQDPTLSPGLKIVVATRNYYHTLECKADGTLMKRGNTSLSIKLDGSSEREATVLHCKFSTSSTRDNAFTNSLAAFQDAADLAVLQQTNVSQLRIAPEFIQQCFEDPTFADLVVSVRRQIGANPNFQAKVLLMRDWESRS